METEGNNPAPTEAATTMPAVGDAAVSPAPAAVAPAASIAAKAPIIEPYTFPSRELLNGPELRRLTADYNEILCVLARRFASLFRVEFDLSLASFQTPTFRQFATSHPQTTHFTLFKIEPLRGIGLIEINPAFALALTERLMGGPGQLDASSRNLTEIEIALFDQVVQMFTQGWCEHWAAYKPLKPVVIGHENDSRYLQTSPSDAPLFLATVNAHLGDVCSKIQFALPFSSLDPLLEKIRAELAPPAESAPGPAAPAAKAAAWNPAYDDVRMAITAQMPGPQITARELPKLKVGDVLDLPAESASQVQLRLGEAARFTGRLGRCDDKWAVEVIQVLKS